MPLFMPPSNPWKENIFIYLGGDESLFLKVFLKIIIFMFAQNREILVKRKMRNM